MEGTHQSNKQKKMKLKKLISHATSWRRTTTQLFVASGHPVIKLKEFFQPIKI